MPNKDPRDANIQHSFAGERAASASITTLIEARRRVEAGIDPERVRRDTGWFVGLDGQWRFEISDDDVAVNKLLLANLQKGGFKGRSIDRITYRKDPDGTYQLLLAPKNPQTLSDLISLRSIPRHVLEIIVPMEKIKAMDLNEGIEDLIGDFEDARAIDASFEFKGFNAIPLNEVITHPALFYAYPSLQNVMVAVNPKLGNGAQLVSTIYIDGTEKQNIYLGNPGHKEVASALLHEIQHVIQGIEGFAAGGSSQEFRDLDITEERAKPINDKLFALLESNPEFGALRRQHTRDWIRIIGAHGKTNSNGQEELDWEDVPETDRETYFERLVQLETFAEHFEYMDLEDERSRIYREAPTLSASEQYLRQAGEVEARNTQARAKLSPYERLTTPPGNTADTPAENVIITPQAVFREAAAAPAQKSSTSTAKATPKSLTSALQSLVAGAGELGGTLGRVVATTAAEIKTHWAPLIGADARTSRAAGAAQGFYEASSNTIFLIADNIKAGDELGVIAHELMHKHGKAVLGQAGWDRLHSAIKEWDMAPLGSVERHIYDEATRRVNQSLGVAQPDLEHSSHELFPYAVEIALRIGVKPQSSAPAGSARAWLAQVRDTLESIWAKISGKPTSMTAEDLVTLAYGIAQRENPEHQTELNDLDLANLPLPVEQNPQFTEWFGQSKAVDDQGRPLILYHGSPADFTVFDHRKIGQNGRSQGPGFYFTDNEQMASSYGKTMQVYVSIQKPLEIGTPAFDARTMEAILLRASQLEALANDEPEENGFLSNFEDVSRHGIASVARRTAKLMANENTALDQMGGLVGSGVSPEIVNQATYDITGYDGVITKSTDEHGKESFGVYVAFLSSQIKSATQNNGEFDRNNRDIRFSTPKDNKPQHRHTPEFDKWFENSKVVDANGLPLVVYHGTQYDFSAFDPEMQGDTVFSGDIGFFFTNNTREANAYATFDWDREDPKPNVMPVYLSIKNPLMVDITNEHHPGEAPGRWYDEFGQKMAQYAIDSGYDGLIVSDMSDDPQLTVDGKVETMYVAFRPEQIKSAIGNNGNFDAQNPDIRFSMPGASKAFKDWFGRSHVVDSSGQPLVVYRGEHGEGSGQPRTVVGTFTFTDDASVASTYAQTPNDMRNFRHARAPHVIPAYLSIENPIFKNLDDPFVEFGDLAQKIGPKEAERFARKHSDSIRETGNWIENYAQHYASVDALLDERPDQLASLYMDAYVLLDDLAFIQVAKEAGFDGAIHIGNGESSSATEYRVFTAEQIKSAIGNSGQFDKNRPDIQFSMPETAERPQRKSKQRPFTIEISDKGETVTAKVGAYIVGKAFAWKDSRDKFVIMDSEVRSGYRRRGIATAMYQAIEQATGTQLTPAVSLSDDAFEFWKTYRPQAVALDLRHWKEHLIGARVAHRGDTGKIIRTSGGTATMEFDTAKPAGTQCTILRDQINAALAAAESPTIDFSTPGAIIPASKNKTDRTPEFNLWFGSSKVVDPNGNPLVMYHGTSKDVDFSRFKVGARGAWFASDPEVASEYAEENDSKNVKYNPDTRRYEKLNHAARVMPVYIRIENPYRLTADDARRVNVGNYAKAQRELFAELKAKGYDGVLWNDNLNKEWVVLGGPEQIKSAIGNNGNFDDQNPDIRFSMPDIKHKPNEPFTDWFGNSKVTDDDGKPRVVYHGTIVRPDTNKVKGMGDIHAFDRLFSTQFRGHSVDTIGSWFSTNPGENGAQMYSGSAPGAVIYPVFLSIQNPHETTFHLMERRARLLVNGKDDGRRLGQAEVEAYRHWLKETGKDGIKIVHDDYNDKGSTEFKHQDAWIALEPHQIQFAIGIQAPSPAEKQSLVMKHRAEDGDDGQERASLHEAERQAWSRYKQKAIEKGTSALDKGERLESASVVALIEEGLLAPDHPQFPAPCPIDEITHTTFRPKAH